MIDVVVRSTEQVADGVRSLELAAADGGPLPAFSAGDHIDLTLGPGLVRSYSLVGTPDPEPYRYRVAVALSSSGRGGSRAVHQTVRPGSRISISAPVGSFQLAEPARHTVLIAGGIGITPILSMACQLSSTGASWEAHYAASSRSAAAFLPELTALSDTAVHVYLRDEDGPRSLKIASIIADAPPDAHIYCCGPATMLDDFTEATRDLDGDRVHMERFTGISDARPAHGYTVELARSSTTLRINEGQSVLDAVLDAGIEVEFSCMEGICGTCRTRVLSGQPDHRDSVLSPAERAAGDIMLICSSGSKGDRLVLDI